MDGRRSCNIHRYANSSCVRVLVEDFSNWLTLYFAVVAGVVSVYSVWDMLRYNRARRNEWIEAQKRLEADALATARIAYLKGKATEEQIGLVEEANREAEETAIKLPPLLSPPEHRTHFEEHVKPAFGTNPESQGILGIVSGLFGGKASSASDASVASTTQEAAADAVASVKDQARDAWENEKENQRHGGSLDQLGLATDGASQPAPKKKGWWPF